MSPPTLCSNFGLNFGTQRKSSIFEFRCAKAECEQSSVTFGIVIASAGQSLTCVIHILCNKTLCSLIECPMLYYVCLRQIWTNRIPPPEPLRSVLLGPGPRGPWRRRSHSGRLPSAESPPEAMFLDFVTPRFLCNSVCSRPPNTIKSTRGAGSENLSRKNVRMS